jgi:tryptophanyl-tRNA synthetase
LLYHGTHVPVGKDQVQHIELTRDCARWFNNRYGAFFPEVEPLLTEIPKVMSLLEPESKMSKSRGLNHVIELADSPEVITKKLKKAVTATDGGDGIAPGVANLLLLLKEFGSVQMYDQYMAAEQDGSIRYGDLKQDLAGAIADHFAEYRERRAELLEQHDEIAEMLIIGAERARERAQETMERVRELIGVR